MYASKIFGPLFLALSVLAAPNAADECSALAATTTLAASTTLTTLQSATSVVPPSCSPYTSLADCVVNACDAPGVVDSVVW